MLHIMIKILKYLYITYVNVFTYKYANNNNSSPVSLSLYEWVKMHDLWIQLVKYGSQFLEVTLIYFGSKIYWAIFI